MSCRKGWSREVLVNEFTNVFVNKTYKEHRENVLFEREKSLMPETQPYVEIEKKCSQFLRERAEFDKQRLEVVRQMRNLQYQGSLEERIQIHRLHVNLRIQERNIEFEMGHLDFIIGEYRSHAPKERRVFTRACPAQNCKGFLSTAWKCGLCEVHVCSKCHEIKEENGQDAHICDPNNIATAEMLARDSKPCPKCASVIFKIDGCDQMFCTQCHTAFSWRTGRVETGAIHNPHYYDYMRTRGGGLPRAPGDLVCGGLPDIFNFRGLETYYPRHGQDSIFVIHRIVQHVQWAILPRYNTPVTADMNRDLRISYMMNELSEHDFKHKIQMREKAENKKRDIREVLTMFTTVAADIFQRLVSNPGGANYKEELTNLREYTNEVLDKVSKRWKCSVPRFAGWTIQ
jgi:hypothetical protein